MKIKKRMTAKAVISQTSCNPGIISCSPKPAFPHRVPKGSLLDGILNSHNIVIFFFPPQINGTLFLSIIIKTDELTRFLARESGMFGNSSWD